MKKFVLVLLIVIAGLVVGAVLTRNIIAARFIEKGVKDLLGLKLSIGSIDIGLLNTTVEVEGLEAYNPRGYTEKYLAEVPEIYIDYVLMDILRGFIHLPEVRIDISQVNVEKGKDGVFNIDCIQSAPKPEKKQEKEKAAEAKEKFLVNKMALKIETIRYIDNTQSPPDIREFKFNYSNTFTDISDPEVIIESIASAVVGQLVAEGIHVALKGFLEDKDFMKALITGDTKGMKEEGKKQLKDLGKQMGQEIFPFSEGEGGGTDKSPGKSSVREKKESIGGLLEGFLGEEKKKKK